MSKSEKELLDFYDLLLLRGGDGSGDTEKANAIRKQQMSVCCESCGKDIWSRALMALSQDQKEEETLRKLYGEIMSMALPKEVLAWWEVLFAVALHAPQEELARIAAANQGASDNRDIACVSGAAAHIARLEIREERRRRREREAKEQKHLKKLQERAEEAAKIKRQAEMDLERHRNARG